MHSPTNSTGCDVLVCSRPPASRRRQAHEARSRSLVLARHARVHAIPAAARDPTRSVRARPKTEEAAAGANRAARSSRKPRGEISQQSAADEPHVRAAGRRLRHAKCKFPSATCQNLAKARTGGNASPMRAQASRKRVESECSASRKSFAAARSNEGEASVQNSDQGQQSSRLDLLSS